MYRLWDAISQDVHAVRVGWLTAGSGVGVVGQECNGSCSVELH